MLLNFASTNLNLHCWQILCQPTQYIYGLGVTQIDGLRILSSIRMLDIMDTSDHFRRLDF